jgi:Carbon dioxide concentrating mechanism/carboxysome shell protein
MGEAYGFFEVPSTTAAIYAVDVMCKTADVKMVTWEKKLGGRLVTVIIKGSVSAVNEAIEAAVEDAIEKPADYCVIASPHEEILKQIQASNNRIC